MRFNSKTKQMLKLIDLIELKSGLMLQEYSPELDEQFASELTSEGPSIFFLNKLAKHLDQLESEG